MNEKKNNKANGTNGAYRAPLGSKPFLPKGDLAIDKMVQAARSCKQNIAAGLIGLMSLMTLMGCSGDSREPEVQEPTELRTPIAFCGLEGEELVTRAHEANGLTRAGTPLSDAGVTTFKVWGYKNMDYDISTGAYDIDDSKLQNVFPGYAVDWTRNSAATSITNSDGWEYILTNYPDQTIKYWDWGAVAYRFFAVTNWGGESAGPYEANTAYGANGTYEGYKDYEMTMSVDVTSRKAIEDMPYFSQLWFSTGNPDDYPTRQFGKPVQLVFLKPYAKVRFMYTYVNDPASILVENQVFKPTADYTANEEDKVKIARKGTFTIHYPLTGTATKEWYSIVRATGEGSGALEAFFEDYDPDDPTKEYIDAIGGWYTVFPNTTQGSYKLTVTINRSEKSCVVPAEYMQWLPGYSYTYIFKINELGGVSIEMVQVAFNDWTELEGKHEVYNW